MKYETVALLQTFFLSPFYVLEILHYMVTLMKRIMTDNNTYINLLQFSMFQLPSKETNFYPWTILLKSLKAAFRVCFCEIEYFICLYYYLSNC